MRTGIGLAVAAVLALVLAGAGPSTAQSTSNVTIFEAWFIHNESMGDPVAVEKGFYKKMNLEVKVVGTSAEPMRWMLLKKVLAGSRPNETST